MEKSENIAALAGALASAQAAIEGAVKDKDNPFFKSKYADLSSVVEAIRTPLSDNGLSYVQICHDEPNAARVETVIMHKSGEWLSCGCVSVPVSKQDAQGFGSAITYARRYSLSAAFGVAPEDDDGNAAVKAKGEAGLEAAYADKKKAKEEDKKAAEEKAKEQPPAKRPTLEEVFKRLSEVKHEKELINWKAKFFREGHWDALTVEEQDKISVHCNELMEAFKNG